MSSLTAGAARVPIPPDEPMPLAGFYVRQGPFAGIHDDLNVRAVTFSDGDTVAALVTVDICVLTDTFWRVVSGRIERELGIPPERMLLNASHTHGAPALYEPPESGAIDASWLEDNPWRDIQRRYTDRVCDAIIGAVAKARDTMRPARTGFGRGSLSIGVNRRAVTADGDIWLGVNPDGPVDREVGIVRVDALDGGTVAVLFNHGCHGTSMCSDLVTGDWCGLASRYVEERMTGTVAAFLSGPAGDVNPIYEERAKFDRREGGAEVLAMLAGDEVIRVAGNTVPDGGGPVCAAMREVSLPGKRYMGLLGYDDSFDGLDPDAPAPDTVLRITALRVGDILFAGASGELFCELGMAVRDRSPFPATCVMGHTNGYGGYVLTDGEAARGGYEYNASIIRRGGETAVVETLASLADMLRRD